MKKTILIIVFIKFSLFGYSQERINPEKPSFENTGLILKQNDAPKYTYNEISKSWDEEKKHPFDFKQLQFKIIKNNGNKYYLLITKAIRDGYKYPYIKEGYVKYDFVSALIFSETEYFKIKNFETGISEYKELKDFENDEDLINKAIYNIEHKNTIWLEYTHYFCIKKENESIIRFAFYRLLSVNDKINPMYFKTKYFETHIEKFNNLLSL
jgi:hypothetical protein